MLDDYILLPAYLILDSIFVNHKCVQWPVHSPLSVDNPVNNLPTHGYLKLSQRIGQ